MSIVVRTDDGSNTIDSERYGQTYHSTNGAVTEARHVFIHASGVGQRLHDHLPTRILEIGFGLGLNALLTADLAAKHATALEYHTIENDLVNADDIRRLGYDDLLGHPSMVDPLLNLIEKVPRKNSAQAIAYARHDAQLTQSIGFSLHLCDASLVEYSKISGSGFHAIYLDAFSPDANAECWSPELIDKLSNVLVDGGRMSTYSAKGTVRRAMLSAGLIVSKRPGPPGKREMLVAQKQNKDLIQR